MTVRSTPPEALEILKIRSEEDARRCAEIMISSEPWITLRRTYEQAFGFLTDPNRERYVGLVDGRLVGFIVLIMKGIFVGYIQTVLVWPEWRGRGIGTELMGFAERRILRDTANVFLCVSSFNLKALKLYERLGYERVGELTDFVVPGHSEIFLRKTIGPLSEFHRESRRGR
jgi:ribosomal protein S18 acetylase RimI-like enzyme